MIMSAKHSSSHWGAVEAHAFEPLTILDASA
jgi:hypothetical protein